ncbi:MAG: hypothetical protein E4G90_10875 [Gemmatimonadales bacterium]|nr:MAG: hypothetical protein E4G90_10875 [Gemmatimonadales bacterium]
MGPRSPGSEDSGGCGPGGQRHPNRRGGGAPGVRPGDSGGPGPGSGGGHRCGSGPVQRSGGPHVVPSSRCPFRGS